MLTTSPSSDALNSSEASAAQGQARSARSGLQPARWSPTLAAIRVTVSSGDAAGRHVVLEREQGATA